MRPSLEKLANDVDHLSSITWNEDDILDVKNILYEMLKLLDLTLPEEPS